MLKRILLALVVLGVLAAEVPAQRTAPAADVRLVLLIAVDQFRYDYLTRFRAEYTDGFKRLLTEGAVFTDANLEHYPTVTAVGHATMLSGAMPAVSGIIGNDWFDRASGATVTSVSDATVKPVGEIEAEPASPRRLLVTTIGDQLKLASPHRKGAIDAPRVIGLSLKDRSAILPVGRGADAAYWWDTGSGRFVTSTYYRNELPPWAQAFNDRRIADSFATESWTLLTAPATVLRKLEGKTPADLYNAVYGSPFGNDLLLQFAEAAITSEQLGQRGAVDLLSVSFSSNDSVGHTHGPDSPHVRDISVRTDRTVGRLLNYVNKTVGLQHSIVAFTTDHGVAPMPEVLKELNLPGGRMTSKEIFDPIQRALEQRFGPGKWVLATAGIFALSQRAAHG